jgi:hypothetical protein
MAKRMGAKTIEMKSSHASMISHPDEIARLILEAVQHVPRELSWPVRASSRNAAGRATAL